ncbi:MAG: ribonucleoside-diphosphate reductase, partial [Methanobacteriota archaeon]
RNTHLLAIAPNKSTALILGGVSEGINPDPAMVYTQTTAAGEVFRINPIFLELMKERGKYKKSVLADICDHFGSVQHLDWLTDDEKLVFRTAFEINQENIVHMAAARQNFVCQSQSLNLFFSADEEERWISHVHKLAFDSNIKALYYVTTMTGVQPNRDCLSCEG